MSYWTYMSIDTGGEEEVDVAEIGNMTSNVAGMWAKALGRPLHEFHGKTGADCIPHFQRAVDAISNAGTRHEYEAMAPKNGWGNVDGAEQYLRDILRACREHPAAKLTVSR